MNPEDLRTRRMALGLSAFGLARLAGLTEQTVVHVETGRVAPRPTTEVALRRGLRLAQQAKDRATS